MIKRTFTIIKSLAGYDVEQMLASIEPMLNLAKAGALDLGRASDLVTDSMSALGKETGELETYLNQVAKTSTLTNTNIDMLMEAFIQTGGMAKTLGINTAELSAALGVLANAGFKGSEAGRALSTVLTRLSKPPKEAQVALDELGISVFDNEGKFLGLENVLGQLNTAFSSLSQEEQAYYAKNIAGQNYISQFIELVSQSGGTLQEYTNKINNSSGALQRMADIMSDNLKGRFDEMKSAIEGALLKAFDTLEPTVTKVVNKITELANKFTELSPTTQKVVIAIAGIVAIIPPLLILFGTLISSIGSIITGLGALATWLSGFAVSAGTATTATATLSGAWAGLMAIFSSVGAFISGTLIPAFTGFAASIGLPVTVVLALIAAGVALIANWDSVKSFMTDCFENIRSAADNAFSWICSKLGADSNEIKSIISDTWNNVKSIIDTLLGDVSRNIQTCWNNIKVAIDNSVGAIFDVISETWDRIKRALEVAGMAINQLIKGDWEGAKKTIKSAVDMIKNAINDGWIKIKEIIANLGQTILINIKNCWNNIKSYISQSTENIKTTVQRGWENLKSATQTAFNNIKAICQTVWNGIKSDISNKVNEIKLNITNAWNTVKSTTTSIWNGINSAISSVWNGIKSTVSSGVNSVKSTISSVFSTLTNIMTAPFKAAQNIISGILNGIGNKINTLKNAAAKLNPFKSIEAPQQMMVNTISTHANEGTSNVFARGTTASVFGDLGRLIKTSVSSYDSINDDINSRLEEQLKKTKEIEDKITQIYQKEVEKRKKLIDDELNKRLNSLKKEQDAYNKHRQEVDYNRSYEDQLDVINELQNKIDIASRDGSLNGQKKLKELMNQLKEEQRKLDDLVMSKIDSDINDMFEKESNRLTDEANKAKEELDNILDPKNLQNLINSALESGLFTDLEGNIYNLKDVMLDFVDEYGEGLSSIGALIKSELVENLNLAKDTMKNLAGILDQLGISGFSSSSYANRIAELDYSSARYNNSSNNPIRGAIKKVKSKQDNQVTVQFNQPLCVIQGNVDNNLMPEIERMIRKAQEQIVNNIASAIR